MRNSDLETLKVQIGAVPEMPEDLGGRLEGAVKRAQASLASAARGLRRALFRRGRKAFAARLARKLASAPGSAPEPGAPDAGAQAHG